MNDTDRPVVNIDYTAEAFDDEVLLYSTAATRAVYLNEAALTVWGLCKGDMTIGQIINYLEQSYPVQRDQIRPDVIAALETLIANNVIGLADGE